MRTFAHTIGSTIRSADPDGPRRSPAPWRTLAAATAVLALLAGCSGGGDEAMSDAVGGAVVAEDHGGAELADLDGAAARRASGKASGEGTDLSTVRTRAVIRKGEIDLVAKDLAGARSEIDDLLQRHGGYLAGEETSNDRDGEPQRSVLVMRVPEPAFDTMMAELGRIGRTERADRSSEDVTTEVIDVDTRVATQEASLRRLRTFLRRATNVDDMIRVESEIASRQAALESLKAQQKYLADQTSMSTITAHLRTPASPHRIQEEEKGFLVGLSDGWRALKAVLVGTATVTGAVLPFAVLIGLLAVPMWLLLRTAVRRRTTAVPLVAGPPRDTEA